LRPAPAGACAQGAARYAQTVHPTLPLKRREILITDAAVAARHFKRGVAEKNSHVKR